MAFHAGVHGPSTMLKTLHGGSLIAYKPLTSPWPLARPVRAASPDLDHAVGVNEVQRSITAGENSKVLCLETPPKLPSDSVLHPNTRMVHGAWVSAAQEPPQMQMRDQTNGSLPTFVWGKVQAWHVIVGICAIAMLLCNWQRSTFTMLLPTMSNQFNFSMSQIGALQSAMLVGYLVGQLPAGSLADRFGGEWVLLWGLLLWSISLAGTSLAAVTHPIASTIVSRFMFGLFSACAMPATSAMAAQWVPAGVKASTIALVYAMFNIGGVLGLIITPHTAVHLGWAGGFLTAAVGGVTWVLLGWAGLLKVAPKAAATAMPAATAIGATPAANSALGLSPSSHHSSQPKASFSKHTSSTMPIGSMPTTAITTTTATAIITRMPSPSQPTSTGPAAASVGKTVVPGLSKADTMLQVAVLMYAHGVIGFGFFVMQSWLPLYLKSLGVHSLTSAGMLSSIPWLAAAIMGAVAGALADGLIRAKMPRLHVRQMMHAVSTLGCAASVLPLAVCTTISPVLATVWLVALQCCYSFSFGGFHAYVQDVAQADAGIMLAVTNSCSIFVGVIGNVVTGLVVEATGSYRAVFIVTALLYLTSFIAFRKVMRGQVLQLEALKA